MNGVLNYLKGIMNDCEGTPSSKRWFTLFFVILYAVGFFAHVFYKAVIDSEIIHSIMYKIISGLGITGAEKFAPKT